MHLELQGTFSKGLPLIGGAKKFFMKFSKGMSGHFAGMTAGGGMQEVDHGYILQVQAHPGCGPINCYIQKPNRIVVQAGVAVTGPGYHQYIADAIRSVGKELNVQWEQTPSADPTGYFFNPNREALERYYLNFLRETVEGMLKDRSDTSLYMPFPFEFEHEGDIATPLGPRTVEWMEAVVQDPSNGLDVFCWWDEGKGPNYHLGRALAILWNHARYRPPLSEYEGKYYSDMLDSFERAYKEAPSMQFPWREWLYFMKLTQRPPGDPLLQAVTRQAAMDDQERPLMGYRQADFRMQLPSGWSFVMPGNMAEEMSDTGMQFWDGSRTIQVGELPIPPEAMVGKAPQEILSTMPPLGPGGLGEELDWNRNGVYSKANIHQANEGGRSYWRLGSMAAAPGSVLVFTLNFDKGSDRDWALGVWNSLEYTKPQD